MFLPLKKPEGGEDEDPRTMTVKEIVGRIREVTDDAGFIEAVMGDNITKEQKTKAIHLIDELIRADKRTKKVDEDTVLGFRTGMMYGLALASKMQVSDSPTEDEMKKKIKQFLFMFSAIDEGLKTWVDDKWFENLMKNAKVSEEVKTKK